MELDQPPMNSKEEVQQTLDLYKNEALKKLAWHLDREVWANVEKGEATTSWGRQQSMIAINNYATNEVTRVLGELVAWMAKERKEIIAVSTKYHENKNTIGAFPHDLQISIFSKCITHAKSLFKNEVG